jgi:hypothetical protein
MPLRRTAGRTTYAGDDSRARQTCARCGSNRAAPTRSRNTPGHPPQARIAAEIARRSGPRSGSGHSICLSASTLIGSTSIAAVATRSVHPTHNITCRRALAAPSRERSDAIRERSSAVSGWRAITHTCRPARSFGRAPSIRLEIGTKPASRAARAANIVVVVKPDPRGPAIPIAATPDGAASASASSIAAKANLDCTTTPIALRRRCGCTSARRSR